MICLINFFSTPDYLFDGDRMLEDRRHADGRSVRSNTPPPHPDYGLTGLVEAQNHLVR